LALSDDDARTSPVAARGVRAGARPLGASARHVRPGALLLLCGAHLSHSCARHRDGLCLDRCVRAHAAAWLQLAGDLSRLAHRASYALSDLPLVRRAEGARHRMVVELSLE